MLQAILIHVFCLLVGLGALAVCAWVAATGQLFTLDGLLMVAVSLSIAAFFVGNTAWAVYTGEIPELLRQLRAKPEATASSSTEEQK
jgi:predicted membrane chloride channel (bestrophin family)